MFFQKLLCRPVGNNKPSEAYRHSYEKSLDAATSKDSVWE